MGDSMERDHGVMSPLLVLMSGGSGWSWRLIDQLRRCGLETITVDVNGLRDAGGFVGRAIDYTLPRVRSPRTGPLRRIALAHGTMFGLCLYGGRQAFELDLLSRALPGFRFGVFAVGSDVLRPDRAQSRVRGLLARIVVGGPLSRAALVLANGEHLAAAVAQLTRGRAVVETWRQGVDVPDGPIRGASEHATLSVVVPRPWDPLYNNVQVVDGVLEYAQHHGSESLRVLFCGPRAGDQDLERLAELDRSFGPSQRLSITDGYDFDARFSIFGNHAVTVSLSTSDGTANSVLEAIASGSLPVLSDIPANRVLVEQFGIFAELVEIGDPGALRRALESISDRQDEWADLARLNRSLVEEHFSAGSATTRLCSLLESVVQR